MFDVAIIGTGPAGISAALNLKLHNKNIIWFGSDELSNKVQKSEKIANYPGFYCVIGNELNKQFQSQISSMGLDICDKRVTAITKRRKGFMLMAENEIYEAKTVLLAIGVVSAKGFKGEQDLLGYGVSYCATCDGFLYKGKTIAVFCGNKKFEHEVAYLAELADKVYLQTGYSDCEIDLPNVEKLPKSIKTVLGDKFVNAIELADGSVISVDGVFCLRNAVAPTTLLPGLEMDGVHIAVDRSNQNTNISGCFAAGDCTGRPYQIAKAIGEGNIAAHSIVEYLSDKEMNVCK